MPRKDSHGRRIAAILPGLLAMMALLALLGGCAARQVVVLMPDRDGHVGKAEVATEEGKRLLEKPGEMTVVSGRSNLPSPPVPADLRYIAATFGAALAVEPLPSEKFILFFETGKTCLGAGSQAVIPTIVAAIKRRNAISISISGHTDAVGSVQLNDRLAHERALAVRELLIQKGVDPQRLTVSSHGKGNPLVPTPDGVEEPRNRRVEVIVR